MLTCVAMRFDVPSPARPEVSAEGVSVEAALRPIELDQAHAIGVWRNVVFALWYEQTTAAAVVRLTSALRRVRSWHPQGVGLIQVVMPSAKQPEKEARDAIQGMLALGSRVITSSALVVPGVGFRIAWIRAFITGLAMVSRPEFPHVVFATLEEAADWQHRLLPPHRAPMPFDVLRAHAELERLHRERYPEVA